MISLKVIYIVFCSLMLKAHQESDKRLNGKRSFGDLTILDGADNVSRVTRENNYFNFRNNPRRHKRNIIRRVLGHLKRSTALESFEEALDRAAPVISSGTWVYPPAYGVLPEGAFSAGLDIFGFPVYIGRAFLPNSKTVIAGRLAQHDICVEIAWAEWGRCVGEYQVLVGTAKQYKWKIGHRDWFPYNYVVAGMQYSKDEGDSKTFVCRSYVRDENYTDHLVIGKVLRNGKCIAAYEGIVTIYRNIYEILTLR